MVLPLSLSLRIFVLDWGKVVEKIKVMFLPDNAAISLWMGDQKRKSRFHKLKMLAFPASNMKKWDVDNLLEEERNEIVANN